MVAWDATRSAVRALHDALPFLVGMREVVVLSVIGDKDFPEIASGPAICQYLSRWNIAARFETRKREMKAVGDILLEYAQRINAQLLVMGGFGHAREREFIFGSATRDIFEADLKMPVLLSH